MSLSSSPRYLGRAPTNDLVLADASVSSRHAAVFTSAGRAFVEDLGSRNGTFVGNKRVRKLSEIKPGEELILGGHVKLLLERDDERADSEALLVLEQADGPLRTPFLTRSLRINTGPAADLRLPDLDGAVELQVSKEGVSVVSSSGEQLFSLGAIFLLGGSPFRVVRVSPSMSVTVEGGQTPGYRVVAALSGPTGPSARLEALPRGPAAQWSAPNRAVLLFLLARKLKLDRSAGVGLEEQGWCGDAEVAVGLWGRDGADRGINVLVTRVRNDLRAVGLDPWIIEKRQGHVRLGPACREIDLGADS